MNTPLTLAALPAFEREFRRDHAREHAALFDVSGKLVTARSGDNDSVTFTQRELNRACLGTLTHTHPLGKPPSGPDLVLAARYGMTLRAVGETPDGESWDYTVKMPAASEQLADQIDCLFDDMLETAEKELARQPWNNFKWEREARHLAITRLAKQLGFAYQRVKLNGAISEMASHEQKRLNTLAGLETSMRNEVFAPLHANLVRSLSRLAGQDGLIPLSSLPAVRREVTRQVQRTMLGDSQNGVLEPYHVQNGQVMPRSAYFKALWTAMRAAATAAVERHAEIMRKHLPQDLRRHFEIASINPFEETFGETEGDDLDPTIPRYDPLHMWIGPDGKQLSDRIWIAAGDMRRKLDAYLTEAIAARKPVQQIANELEAFLLPGKGSYEAMRLARTEVSAAGNRADSAAAQLDPFVETYSFFTAPSHECCDECDIVQANSPYPKSDMTHLPPRHPNCICGIVWNMVKNIQAVILSIRQQIEAGLKGAKKAIADYIGPLSKRFIDLLFRGRK
jgi:hypothetical protein